MPAADIFSQDEWDALLDGSPHEVDLMGRYAPGGIPGFRAAVYREAEKRYGHGKTKRTGPTTIEVIGIDCRPDFARRHKASPSPYYALPPEPAPAPSSAGQDLSDQDLGDDDLDPDLLLGPCTCGQAPTCLPSCARFS